MTSLNHEKVNRTKKASWSGSSGDLPGIYNWHRRHSKFPKRCYVCGNLVPAGPALMRKAGDKWQVKHSYHKDIAST